jgi:hypothetical protein
VALACFCVLENSYKRHPQDTRLCESTDICTQFGSFQGSNRGKCILILHVLRSNGNYVSSAGLVNKTRLTSVTMCWLIHSDEWKGTRKHFRPVGRCFILPGKVIILPFDAVLSKRWKSSLNKPNINKYIYMIKLMNINQVSLYIYHLFFRYLILNLCNGARSGVPSIACYTSSWEFSNVRFAGRRCAEMLRAYFRMPLSYFTVGSVPYRCR